MNVSPEMLSTLRLLTREVAPLLASPGRLGPLLGTAARARPGLALTPIAGGVLGGVALGVAAGVFLAPATGQQARAAVARRLRGAAAILKGPRLDASPSPSPRGRDAGREGPRASRAREHEPRPSVVPQGVEPH